MKANKLTVTVGCLMTLGSAVWAAEPTVPTAQFYGTINGKTSIWVEDPHDVTNYWFQTKGLSEDDSAWRTIDFELRPKNLTESKAFPNSLIFRRTADFSGVACFRVANTNALGESAGWLTFGGTTNFLRHVGEAFGCTGTAPKTQPYVFDGEVSSFYESYPDCSGTEFPWVGLKFDKPVTVSRIRFAPRLSDLVGWRRLTGDVFQYADDAEFTNPVTIGTVPEAKNITGVSEIVLDRPVTARYFRVLHLHVMDDPYISIAEMELVAEGLTVLPELRVSCSDYTNLYAKIEWQIPEGVQCPSGIVQRSVSPAGPFADIGEWTVAGVKGSLVDKTAALAVPYYYRLRVACDYPLAAASELVSEPVFYRRSKRLDRDWNDLTKLKTGVSVMYPFAYLGMPAYATVGLDQANRAFDGMTDTNPDKAIYTNASSRCYNPEVGVDLGAPHHITALLAINPISCAKQIYNRMRAAAVFGANTAEQTDAVQLSLPLTSAEKDKWFYLPMADSTESYRYAYLREPVESVHWYGNVAEVGFFGWCEQDILETGVLVPPTEIAVSADAVAMTVTWNAGYNVASYLVQRRVAGTEAWTDVATLPPSATSCTDGEKLRKGSYEFRVLATGTDGTTGLTVAAGCDFRPKRGMLLLFR